MLGCRRIYTDQELGKNVMRQHELQVRPADRLVKEQAGILTREFALVKDPLAVNKFVSI